MKLIDIAFDLDGVLVDFIKPLRYWLHKLYDAKIIDDSKYRLIIDPFLTIFCLKKCFYLTYKNHSMIKAYPGAYQLLRTLWDLSDNDPIRIITARSAISAANYTHKLLKNILSEIPYNLSFALRQDKLLRLNRCAYFVEDNRQTAIELAKNGKKVFLVKKSYNKLSDDYPNITPIDDLYYLLERVESFIKEEDCGKC